MIADSKLGIHPWLGSKNKKHLRGSTPATIMSLGHHTNLGTMGKKHHSIGFIMSNVQTRLQEKVGGSAKCVCFVTQIVCFLSGRFS